MKCLFTYLNKMITILLKNYNNSKAHAIYYMNQEMI